MKWKTYTVEFQQTIFTRIDVKARNKDEAFDKATKKQDEAEYYRSGDLDINTILEAL